MNNAKMLYLGKRIKSAREQSGLTQEQLAEKLNISRTAIARYELGEIEPRLKNLVAIAKALNCSCDYLLGINDHIDSDMELSPRAQMHLCEFIREIKNNL